MWCVSAEHMFRLMLQLVASGKNTAKMFWDTRNITINGDAVPNIP